LSNVGRVLDSRWMMAFSVLAVLVAIAWVLLEQSSKAPQPEAGSPGPLATVELLGVPADADILLDGRRIENTVFGVSPHVRHALEVKDAKGRSWRQVFVARGSLTLVVDPRTCFAEIQVPSTGQGRQSH
jgi:hypothetical protein